MLYVISISRQVSLCKLPSTALHTNAKLQLGTSYCVFPGYYYQTRRWRGNTLGRVCLCVCVCLSVLALTVEILDLETSFSVPKYNFGMSWSSSYVKVIDSRSRSQEQKVKRVTKYTCSRVFCLNLDYQSVLKLSSLV